MLFICVSLIILIKLNVKDNKENFVNVNSYIQTLETR